MDQVSHSLTLAVAVAAPSRSAHGKTNATHIVESLQRLAKLKDSGALSEKGFKAAKTKLLS
jgi:hypothetical protein